VELEVVLREHRNDPWLVVAVPIYRRNDILATEIRSEKSHEHADRFLRKSKAVRKHSHSKDRGAFHR